MTFKTINVLSIGFSLSFILWVLWLCGAGFDISDEGFYLNSIAYADSYKGTTSQFGYIYKALYFLSNGDLYTMRVSNTLLIYLSTTLAFIFCLKTNNTDKNFSTIDILALSMLLATSCFSYLTIWQPTPNYNTLNIIALNCAAIALFWSLYKPNSITPLFLIGIAGWLAFMAKPTTGASLGILIFIYFISTSRQHIWRNTLISALSASTLLLATAWLIDGSLTMFFERLQLGLARGSTLLESKRTLPSLFWNGKLSPPLLLNAIAITALIFFLLKKHSVQRVISKPRNIKLTSFLLAGLLIFVLLAILGLIDIPTPLSKTNKLIVPLIYIIVILTFASSFNQSGNQQNVISRILLFIPYAYVFGTTNDYIRSSTLVMNFFMYALIYEIVRCNYFKNNKIAVWLIAITTLLLTMLSTFNSTHKPYRQQGPITQQKVNGVYGSERLASIKITSQQKKYFDQLTLALQENGFNKNDPIIDLTGRSPGALYAINAYSISAPWLIGGYPGSKNRIIMDLKMSNESLLQQAWVIIEDNNYRSTSSNILNDLGLNFPDNFQLVAEIESHYNYLKNDKTKTQLIYKPK